MIERKILQYAVLESLREKPPSQYSTLVRNVEEKLGQLNLFPTESVAPLDKSYYDRKILSPADKDSVREIIWDLIIQRILTIGANESNADWPWLRVTDYGRKCIESREFLPHDSDGYLDKLTQAVPTLDPLINKFVGESLGCFRVGCYLAASVMAGAASERIFDLLLESLAGTFTNEEKRRDFYNRVNGRQITVRKKEFDQQISRLKGSFSAEVQGSLDNLINGIFALLKEYRDDSGHPTGRTVERDEVFANLLLFPTYCMRAYKLRDEIVSFAKKAPE